MYFIYEKEVEVLCENWIRSVIWKKKIRNKQVKTNKKYMQQIDLKSDHSMKNVYLKKCIYL
jgi:hypothetical protein